VWAVGYSISFLSLCWAGSLEHFAQYLKPSQRTTYTIKSFWATPRAVALVTLGPNPPLLGLTNHLAYMSIVNRIGRILLN
jgi:hypothetical protein